MLNVKQLIEEMNKQNIHEEENPKIKKKKKARKLDDYADLGYGYDSDDPFIDNSEVHDEIVPENLTTAHGGFYVNSGK